MKVYDSAARLMIDRECTDRAKAYIKRSAGGDKPFFCFIPYTQTHLPVEPEPSRKGKTGNGKWADVLDQLDDYVGELLDTVEEAGIADNTIFIFTADNGPEAAIPHQGFGGPWRGSYFTGLEGSLRVPFLIRWPGKVPAGAVSNEIVHEMDLFPTFAKIAGVARCRAIASSTASTRAQFLLGKQKKSEPRVGRRLRRQRRLRSEVAQLEDDDQGARHRLRQGTDEGVLRTDCSTTSTSIPVKSIPCSTLPPNFWVRYPVGEALLAHAKSLKKEIPIRPGTPDPYVPGK